MPPTERTRAVCLPLEEWPEGDAAAWRLALEPAADPFCPLSAASSWSRRSRIKAAKGYGRWLEWALQNAIDMNQPPADRVNREDVEKYIAELRSSNGDYTVLCRVQELYDAMRVLAPGRDWSWLRRAQRALRSRAVPVRDKASRMQPAGALANLGKTLIAAAEVSQKPALSRAVLFRDGLMLAFEAFRPLRLSNLAMIRLGVHLIRQTTGYRLYFQGAEMKGRRPFGPMIPPILVSDFDRYISCYRPILLTRGGRQPPSETDRLWISEIGTPLDGKSIPQRIKKHTRAAFGKHLWPHLFRDCAATSIAVEDPKNARSIPILLDHMKAATSERHYNQARGLEASRRYHRIMTELLDRLDANRTTD